MRFLVAMFIACCMLLRGLADCTETSDSLAASYSLYAVSNHMGILDLGLIMTISR